MDSFSRFSSWFSRKSMPILIGVGALVAMAIAIPVFGLKLLARSPVAVQATEPALTAPIKVAALGRIEPVSGVIKVGGPINEILEQLLVKEGDWVNQNQIIGYLRSFQERQSELANAKQQLQTAQGRLSAETHYSEAELQQRTVDSAIAPLVEDSGIAAQRAATAGLKSEQSLAAIELKRYQFLLTQGATSQSELDARQAKVDQLDQQIRQGEETLQQLINTRDREIATVQAQVSLARSNTARIQANSEVDAAKQSVQLAQVRLENAIIRAPQTGRVLRLLTKQGESIGDDGRSKGSILEIADTRTMQVIAEVNESDIRLVKPGQVAQIVSRNKAFADELWGQVTEIGTQIYKNDLLNDDPSAMSDARVVEVKVRLLNSQAVAKFTNLQVDVKIGVQPPDQPSDQPSSQPSDQPPK